MATKRGAVLFVATGVMLILSGCSTSPCADFLDFCKPGRFPANGKGEAGGVCIPQGGQIGGAISGPPVAPFMPGPGAPFGPAGVPETPALCRFGKINLRLSYQPEA